MTRMDTFFSHTPLNLAVPNTIRLYRVGREKQHFSARFGVDHNPLYRRIRSSFGICSGLWKWRHKGSSASGLQPWVGLQEQRTWRRSCACIRRIKGDEGCQVVQLALRELTRMHQKTYISNMQKPLRIISNVREQCSRCVGKSWIHLFHAKLLSILSIRLSPEKTSWLFLTTPFFRLLSTSALIRAIATSRPSLVLSSL
jgi:hypothetical protein